MTRVGLILTFIIGSDYTTVDKNKLNPRPTKSIFLKASIFGAVLTIPSLVAFFVSWYILGDKINAAIIGVIVHFVGMGFLFKISKRLFKIKTS